MIEKGEVSLQGPHSTATHLEWLWRLDVALGCGFEFVAVHDDLLLHVLLLRHPSLRMSSLIVLTQDSKPGLTTLPFLLQQDNRM